MAWENSLLEASFRNVGFDALRTDDSADRAVAEHAYPYRDGADVEDLGRGPHRIAIEALFFGADYEARLQAFLAALDTPGPGILRHPVFADLTVVPTRVTVRHEADGVDQCAVSVEFVEATPGNPFFDRSLPVQDAETVLAAGDLARGRLAAGLAEVVGTLRARNPLALFSSLREAMTLPLLAMVGEVQGVLLSGLDVLAEPRAFCNDLSLLVDGVLNLREFAGGSLLADFAAVRRTLGLWDTLAASPTATSPPVWVSGVASENQAVAAVAAVVRAQQAMGVAIAASLLLAAEAETRSLSPPQIETVANRARADVEAAIVALRGRFPLEGSRPQVEALKDLAKAVQDAARSIIEARPPLLLRAATVSGNLRLQAHAWYGDHSRGPEIFRLNPSLRWPNFIAQGEMLHAFAR